MKTQYSSLLISLAILLVGGWGCTNYEEVESSDDIVFTAGFEDVETRTFIDTDYHIHWTANDTISIFTTTTNVPYLFNGNTGDDKGSFSKVEGYSASGNKLQYMLGVYPYKASSSLLAESADWLVVTLPHIQEFENKGFKSGTNTMVAVAPNKTNYQLLFKNLCGFLVFKLYGKGTIKSIELKGNNSEYLSGSYVVLMDCINNSPEDMLVYGPGAHSNSDYSILLDCGEGVRLSNDASNPTEFWFVVPPITFENGFTITITDARGFTTTRKTTLQRTIERNTIYTMHAEELKELDDTPISVDSLIVSQKVYDISSEAQTVSVEVQTNVQFSVTIDDACKGWIKQIQSNSPSSNILLFEVMQNEDYSSREGEIRISQVDGVLYENVHILQRQVDGLFANTECSLSQNSQQIKVEVKANVDFEVLPQVEWVQYVETRGLKTNQIVLAVSENTSINEREGTVLVRQKEGHLSSLIKIKQERDTVIDFADRYVKERCVNNYDTNKDGEVTRGEAAKVKHLTSRFFKEMSGSVQSFEELRYFTSLTSIISEAFYNCKKLEKVTLPPNIRVIGEMAFFGCKLTSIELPPSLERIEYYGLACKLDSIALPSSLQYLGSLSLFGNLFKTLVIPPTADVGAGAFSGCPNLEYVRHDLYSSEDNRCIIIDGELRSAALAGLSKYRIPDEAKSIIKEALFGAVIDTLILNEYIIDYPVGSLRCEAKNIVLPSTTRTISCRALQDYLFITNMNSPGVQGDIYLKATTPPVIDEPLWLSSAIHKLYIPMGSLNDYLSDEKWKYNESLLEEFDYSNSCF